MDEIETLERELHELGTRQSESRLKQLLHPEFREIGRSGRQYTRETILARLADADPPDVYADQFRLVDLQPGVVLVCYRSAHVDAEGGLHRFSRRSSVWVRDQKGWQMVFHQGTPSDSADDSA